MAFAAIQSHAMGRLRRDLPWLLLGLLAVLLASSYAASGGLLREAFADLGTTHVPVLLHVAYRVIALAFFYFYWRRLQPGREQLLHAGIAAEPGYAAGVAALLIGLVGGTLLLLSLRGPYWP